MKGWKTALLILIGLVFVITSIFALTWYSISATALNANTYKNIMNKDTLKQFAGQQLPVELESNLDQFLPVINTYFDNVFNYINGRVDKINLQLPNDEIMKPLVIAMAKEQYPETSQLTDEQFNAVFEQQYPTVKLDLQTKLDAVSLDLEQQLKEPKNIISIASTVALVCLIISLVLLLIVVLLIRQLRSIFNWIGSYLLITGIIVSIIGIAILSIIPAMLSSIPTTDLSMVTSLISGLLSPLVITGVIVAVIGLVMVLVKFVFKKAEPETA
jgi:hypothetical protein